VLRDARLVRGPGDAEVEELQVAVVLEQDVGRLEVPVDEAPLVHDLQRRAQLGGNPEALLEAEGLVLDDPVEGASLEVLHRDVRRPIELVVFEDGRDVRMVELGGVLGLAVEALIGLWVDLGVGPEDLQGDRSPELRIHSAIHLAEGPFTEAVLLRVEFEVGESHGGLRAGELRPDDIGPLGPFGYGNPPSLKVE